MAEKQSLSESDTIKAKRLWRYEPNTLLNADCLPVMREIPDKFFQLAIVDPPYGIGNDGQKKRVCKNTKQSRKEHERKDWDSKGIPGAEYFWELERISENQIIWGGNYFVKHLKAGHKGWIIWDKGQRGLTMSDCEIAYTSFDCPTRIATMNRVELLKEGTIHPTQKPAKLYEWILTNYAEPRDRIIDTHVGSGSCPVACHRLKFEWYGMEINKGYYADADKRIRAEKAQLSVFDLIMV